jgi:hypothetical protein
MFGPYQIKNHVQSFTGAITANGSVSCTIPNGPTLLSTLIEFRKAAGALMTKAEFLAEIGLIEMFVGSTPIVRATAQELSDFADFIGRGFQTGYLEIFHAMIWQELQAGREVYGIGTAELGQTAVTVRVNFKATVTNVGASGGGVACYGFIDPRRRSVGGHLRFESFNRSFATASIEEIIDLPKASEDDAYLMLQFSADTITTQEIIVDGVVVQDSKTTKELLQIRNIRGGRTTVASRLHTDFSHRNTFDSILPKGMQEFKIRQAWSSAPGAYTLMAVRAVGLSRLQAK